MSDPAIFADAFRPALVAACAGRRITQKRLAMAIAEKEVAALAAGRRPPDALPAAARRWEKKLSAWKTGADLPAHEAELFAAVDEVAPGARQRWRQLWRRARQDAPVEVRPAAVLPGRSGYLTRVAQIPPPALIARDAELAEMAAFCLAPDPAECYRWWRAPAWAGKTALMATFVTTPPPEVRERVRIVSFFVTARLTSQETREGFLREVVDQLVELTGHDRGDFGGPTDPERQLLPLLDAAAARCRADGVRLVLVVDGLDEDRGVTIGPQARSIAGLLPPRPPAGVRIVVAGRADPAIPDDVVAWHPLRDPRTVRPLTSSPHAQKLRDAARTELRRLLHGSDLERDLLGLLTAARGGLTAPDLQQLAGAPMWEVEAVLRSVAGRTFARRPGTWRPADDASTAIYLLGHEELQAEAVHQFGGERLAGLRERIHRWADDHRHRGWPADTPEYLATGYHQLLVTTGDRDRLVGYGKDRARHAWLRDLTGADAANLAEVRVALDLVVDSDPPDLATAVELALLRGQLTRLDDRIPTRLPAVWAGLGHLARAAALASSITYSEERVEALAGMAAAWVASGRWDEAGAAAVEATVTARSIRTPHGLGVGLVRAAGALADAGFTDRAAAVARLVAPPTLRVQALVAVLDTIDPADRALAARIAGDAVDAACAITLPHTRAQALLTVVRAVAGAGHDEQATMIADAAVALAASFPDAGRQVSVLAMLSRALADAGYPDQADCVARAIPRKVRRDEPPSATAWVPVAPDVAGRREADALVDKVLDLLDAGRADAASEVARSITDPDRQGFALVEVVSAVARAGGTARATRLARSITTPRRRAQALTALARVVLSAGFPDEAAAAAAQAVVVAGSVHDGDLRGIALVDAADALLAVGRSGDAAEAADEAAGAPEVHSAHHAFVRVEAVRVLAAAGRPDRAVELAGSIADPNRRDFASVEVVRAVAGAGQFDRAVGLAGAIADEGVRAHAVAVVARTAVAAGHPDDAVAATRSLADPTRRNTVARGVVEALVQADHLESALALARSITDSGWRAYTLREAACRVAAAGHVDRAVTVARFPGRDRARALAEVAWVAVGAGQHEQAAEAAAEAGRLCHARREMIRLPYGVAGQVSSLVTAGHLAAAEELARLSDDRDVHDEVALGVVRRAAEAGDLQQALSAARSVIDPRGRGSARTTIAQELAGTGDVALAVRIARLIDDPGQQEHALEMIVRTTVVARLEQRRAWHAPARLGQALRIARSITDPATRMSATAAVLSAARLAGAERRVRAILKEMLTVFCDLAPDDGRAALIAVRALVACGAARQAGTVGRTIVNPFYRSIAVAALVPTHGADREHADRLAAEAVAAARSVEAPRDRESALALVAAELARAGHLATALTAIAAMPQPGPRAAALVKVAAPCQQGALVAEAMATVRAIEPVRERAEALLDLVPGLCSAGHPDHAVEAFTEGVAAEASNTGMLAYALERAAVALVEAGRGDDAEAVIRSMGDPRRRVQALAMLARTLSLVDGSGRAAALAAEAVESACSLSTSYERGWALDGVAKALADRQPADARRAVAAALRADSHESVGLALRLDPAVANTVMDLMPATKPDHV